MAVFPNPPKSDPAAGAGVVVGMDDPNNPVDGAGAVFACVAPKPNDGAGANVATGWEVEAPKENVGAAAVVIAGLADPNKLGVAVLVFPKLNM